ncbi:MAG TPA: sodium-dependent transporter [Burkholderiales bacterium]
MSARGQRRIRSVAAAPVAAAPAAPSQAPAAAARAERWSSSIMFVLALAGSAVGFKTFWYFPGIAAENGGGAFITIYLLLAFLFGAPLLIAQVMLGRRTHASPVKAFTDLAPPTRSGRQWALVGALAVVAGFITFSYLSVIAGWAMAYAVRALFGGLAGLTADGLGNRFAAFVQDPEKQLFWHSMFVLATGAIVARGVRRGLEPAARWLAPALYAALLVLAVYAAWIGGLGDAARHLFAADFAKLTPRTWLTAAAQVFFSLGLGTGVALMYGAYLKADASIPRATMTVVGLDVLTSIAVALVVFAVLFGGGVAPASGPTLLFQALPLAFDHLPHGRWLLALLFGLLVVVALLAGIALLEPVVVWLEERFAARRLRAVAASAAGAWMLGLATVLSFNYAAFSFSVFGVEKQLGAFDVLQSLSAELMLPLAAVLMAVFAGWMLKPDDARADLAMQSPCAFDAWLWLLRLLAPPLLVVLLFSLYWL